MSVAISVKRCLVAFAPLLVYCNHSTTSPSDASSARPSAQASATSSGDPSAQTTPIDDGSATAQSRFYVAHGTFFKNAFDFALERRGEDAMGLFAADSGGRVVALRGRVTPDGTDAFRFSLDATEHHAGTRGVHVEGRVASGAIRELDVHEPDRKSPIATTLATTASAGDFDGTYAGTLGAPPRSGGAMSMRAHIRVKLSRTAGTLGGIYRYTQSTDDLRLSGHVAGDGTFEMDESASGRVTGHFSGAFVGKLGVLARWTSPDGKRSYDVVLAAGAGYPEAYAMTANVGRVVPQERYTKAAPFCEDSRIVPAFDGLPDPAAQRALDTALAQQASLFGPPLGKQECESSTEDIPYSRNQEYAIDGERPGFVGMTSSIYEFTGGAHGTYSSRCFVADLGKHVVVRLAPQLTPAGHAKIRALAIQALEKKNKVTHLTEAGFFEDAPNLGDAELCFTMDGKDAKLRVDFQLYAIAPYVMGAPSITLDGKDVSGAFQPGTTGALLFP